MREILFRAKTVDDNKWEHGYYYTSNGEDAWIERKEIDSPDFWEAYLVNPETLSQFTGLTDKNGVKIFEGDIVKHYNNSFNGFDIGRVFWSQKLCCYRRTSSLPDAQFCPVDYSMGAHCEYVVIGNIYDNPELLEEETKRQV